MRVTRIGNESLQSTPGRKHFPHNEIIEFVIPTSIVDPMRIDVEMVQTSEENGEIVIPPLPQRASETTYGMGKVNVHRPNTGFRVMKVK